MDVVVPYIHERKQFNQSIGEFQLVQGKVADMYTQMNAARSYVYTVAKPVTVAKPRVKMPQGQFYMPQSLQPNLHLMPFNY